MQKPSPGYSMNKRQRKGTYFQDSGASSEKMVMMLAMQTASSNKVIKRKRNTSTTPNRRNRIDSVCTAVHSPQRLMPGAPSITHGQDGSTAGSPAKTQSRLPTSEVRGDVPSPNTGRQPWQLPHGHSTILQGGTIALSVKSVRKNKEGIGELIDSFFIPCLGVELYQLIPLL